LLCGCAPSRPEAPGHEAGPPRSAADPAAPGGSSRNPSPPPSATGVSSGNQPRADPPVPAPAAAVAPRARAPFTATLKLRRAPFGEHPQVLVHAADDLRGAGPLAVVVFLHGWYGCLSVLVGAENGPCKPGGETRYAMDVLAQFDRAGVAALLVVPQLAFDLPSSATGRLAQRGAFRELLDELLARPELAGVIPGGQRAADVRRLVLFAHSGAYAPLGKIVGVGGVEVSEIHLLDALYQDVPALRAWGRTRAAALAAGEARLTITYTDGEKTGPRSLRLLGDLAAMLPSGSDSSWQGDAAAAPAAGDLRHALVAVRTGTSHEAIPRAMLAPLLETARLARLPPAAPAEQAPR
jgi:hypothetical protein